MTPTLAAIWCSVMAFAVGNLFQICIREGGMAWYALIVAVALLSCVITFIYQATPR